MTFSVRVFENPELSVTGDPTAEFGNVTVGSNKILTPFIISNSGSGTLFTAVSLPEPFVLLSPSLINLEAGESSTVSISFNPETEQTFSETITFLGNGTTITRVLTGSGVSAPAPDIYVFGNGYEIVKDDFTPVTDDGTHFGDVNIDASQTNDFTISNSGNADLVFNFLPTVTITGLHADDFLVVTQPTGPVQSSSSSSFSIKFTPQEVGVRSAVVEVRSNDADKNPYCFALIGNGILPPDAPVIENVADQLVVSGSYQGPTPNLSQGDSPITWSLQTGPTGMSINPDIGVVSSPSAMSSGSPHQITIRATNSAGFYEESWLLAVIDHTLTIDKGPYATPNPVASQGQVNLFVTASDSMNHQLSYSWTANCPGLSSNGSFSNPQTQSPVWTAPENLTESPQECTLQVVVDDGQGLTASGSVDVVVNPVVRYFLTTTLSGEGEGTITSTPSGINCGGQCSSSFIEGTEVVLTATPAPGSEFVGWGGDACGTETTCTLLMDGERSVNAEFAKLQVAAPVFGQPSGDPSESITIPITSATLDAEISYTLDGSIPSRENGTIIANGSSITISEPLTVKAIAYKDSWLDSATTSASYFTSSMPDTGQTQCYDNTGPIACPLPGEPFCGQDAQYVRARSFTKLTTNGDDNDDLDLEVTDPDADWLMVKDNVTGLIWEVKHLGADGSNYDNPNDADNTYTWYDSNAENQGDFDGGNNTEEYIKALNEAKYGGHSDWRLPTVEELSILINPVTKNPTAVDTIYFPMSGVIK